MMFSRVTFINTIKIEVCLQTSAEDLYEYLAEESEGIVCCNKIALSSKNKA